MRHSRRRLLPLIQDRRLATTRRSCPSIRLQVGIVEPGHQGRGPGPVGAKHGAEVRLQGFPEAVRHFPGRQHRVDDIDDGPEARGPQLLEREDDARATGSSGAFS